MIKHANEKLAEFGVNVFYSTPSCFIKALHDEGIRLESSGLISGKFPQYPISINVNRKRSGSPKKVNKHRLHYGAMMTSQLCHNFQASQPVNGADDITTPIFRSKSILSIFVVPKLLLLYSTEGWSGQPYSINFDVNSQESLNIQENFWSVSSPWRSLRSCMKLTPALSVSWCRSPRFVT